MALALTQLTEGGDAANKTAGQSYATASVSPTTGSITLLLVQLTATIANPTITGARSAWAVVNAVDWNTGASPVDTLCVFVGTGTVTAEAITITVADNTSSAQWKVIDVTGQHLTTPVVQSATDTTDSGTTTQPALAAFGNAANYTLLVFVVDLDGGTMSFEGSYVALGTAQGVSENRQLHAAYLAGNDTTPTGTFSASRDLASVALEIAPAAASTIPRKIHHYKTMGAA